MCPARTRGYRWLSRLGHRDLERQYERCDIALWRPSRGNVWKQRTTEVSLGFPTRIELLVLSHRESQIEMYQTRKWLSCIQSREEVEGLTCPKIPDWTSEGRRRIPLFCISFDIFLAILKKRSMRINPGRVGKSHQQRVKFESCPSQL